MVTIYIYIMMGEYACASMYMCARFKLKFADQVRKNIHFGFGLTMVDLLEVMTASNDAWSTADKSNGA